MIYSTNLLPSRVFPLWNFSNSGIRFQIRRLGVQIQNNGKHVPSTYGLCIYMCVNVCTIGWQHVGVGDDWIRRSLSEQSCFTSWNVERMGVSYHHVTVEGVEEGFLNKKLTPCWASLRARTCRAIFLSLRDPWETLNQPSSRFASSLVSSITPTLSPVSPHISLPPRLDLTIALIVFFYTISPSFMSSLCAHFFVSFQSLVVARPPRRPQPVSSLHLSVATNVFFLQLLGKRYLFFPIFPFFSHLFFLSYQAAKWFGTHSGLWEDPGGLLLYEATSLNK